MRKKPEVDLKLKYKKVLELGMVLSLVILVLVFQALRAIDMDEAESKTPDIEIEVTDIRPSNLKDLRLRQNPRFRFQRKAKMSRKI